MEIPFICNLPGYELFGGHKLFGGHNKSGYIPEAPEAAGTIFQVLRNT